MSDIWSGIGVDISAADGEWLYRVKGEVKGPLRQRTIVDKLLKGELTLDTPVAREGGDFYPIGRVAAFAEHLEEAAERQRTRNHKRRTRIVGLVSLLLIIGGGGGGYFAIEQRKRLSAERTALAMKQAAERKRRAEELSNNAPKMKLVALVTLGTKEDVKIRRQKRPRRGDSDTSNRSEGTGKARARKPQAAEEEEMVSGCKLSQSTIFATLGRHLGKLNVCVEDEKARDTQGLLPDTLALDFVVKPTGQVVDFSIDNRHYRRGPMNNCLIKAFRAIRFPTSTGSNCPVTIPIKIGG